MRPSRLRVFDGLRVATEHVDHLQDSLQSSIEDLREAVGLGHMIRPFTVAGDGDDAIVVGPGLAFDERRRRLALDEPLRVEVAMPAGRDEQYVCIQHDVVEEGEIEGTATLIFDSVAVVLRDAAPGAAEDLLALAKLERVADGGPGFVVVPLEDAETAPSDEGADGDEEGEAPAAPAEPATEEAAKPAAPGEPAAPAEPAPAEPAEPAVPAPAAAGEVAVPPAPAVAVPAAPAAPALRARQGVMRLPAAGEPVADAVAALRAAVGNGEVRAADVTVRLASTDARLDIAPTTVSCTVQLTAALDAGDGPVARLESLGRGEATLDPAGGGRFGFSTVRLVPSPDGDDAGGAWTATDVTEAGVASLPLAPAVPDATARELLRGLRLVVDMKPVDQDGLAASCALVWSGPIDDARMAALGERIRAVAWSAAVGWKALGA